MSANGIFIMGFVTGMVVATMILLAVMSNRQGPM